MYKVKKLVQISLKKDVNSGGLIDHVKVLWDTNQYTWEPVSNIILTHEEEVNQLYALQKQKEEAKKKKAEPSKMATTPLQLQDRQCTMDHNSAATYESEEVAGYCKLGCYLNGVRCFNCNKTFVHLLPNNQGNNDLIRPTSANAVHCCTSFRQFAKENWWCKHAWCNSCWTSVFLSTTTSSNGKNTRVKRGCKTIIN
jgi:hypothetical protein